jgi:hypothetical protein
VFGDWLPGEVAPGLYFVGDLPRHIIGPMFKGVEGRHANRRI